MADTDDAQELMELADELLLQATEIRRQWSELAEALGVDPAPGASPGIGHAAEEIDEEPMRLVALDMLLSGRSREEIAAHLREAYGDEGVDALVAGVFDEFGAG